MVYYFIAFFLAGWFSAVIGFEVSPTFGNIAGILSFITLILIKSRKIHS